MINWFKWLVLSVLTLLLLTALGLYTSLRLSLPALDGNSATYHVNAPTELSRDELGHAIINANDIFDAAYALGLRMLKIVSFKWIYNAVPHRAVCHNGWGTLR